MPKEEKDMSIIQQRLTEINQKIDLKANDFWAQAEQNLKTLEKNAAKKKGEQGANKLN